MDVTDNSMLTYSQPKFTDVPLNVAARTETSSNQVSNPGRSSPTLCTDMFHVGEFMYIDDV
jgi:hypothetical protein